MSSKSSFEKTLALVKRAYDAVSETLAGLESGEALGEGISYGQLVYCRRVLERIMGQLESRKLPPIEERESEMGRLIADSWPFSSALGSLLLEAEQSYRGL